MSAKVFGHVGPLAMLLEIAAAFFAVGLQAGARLRADADAVPNTIAFFDGGTDANGGADDFVAHDAGVGC